MDGIPPGDEDIRRLRGLAAGLTNWRFRNGACRDE